MYKVRIGINEFNLQSDFNSVFVPCRNCGQQKFSARQKTEERAVVVFLMKINQELISLEMFRAPWKISQGLVLKCNLFNALRYEGSVNLSF
jgi:hypothetical protein